MANIGQLHYATVVLPNGGTTSGSQALAANDFTLVGIITPGTITSTSVTFQASHDNSTFNAVTNTSGTSYTVTVAASKFIAIDPADFAGVSYLKVVAGSTEGGNRNVILVLRRVR